MIHPATLKLLLQVVRRELALPRQLGGKCIAFIDTTQGTADNNELPDRR
jgi:hypothetical protein